MATIDWTRVRPALARAGHPCSADPADILTAWFATAAGRAPDDVLRALGRAAVGLFPAYGMTTPARVAEFTAQTAHETGGYARFAENLSYGAQRLAEVWPSRFATNPHAADKEPNALARQLAGKPQDIANVVYARPDEGNAQPGDGWRYRGRGMLQLTFRGNYRTIGKRLGLDLEGNPDLAADPAVSLRIALDFWQHAAVNSCCDRGDYRGARGLTNCGTATPKVDPIGLADVAARRAALLKVLG